MSSIDDRFPTQAVPMTGIPDTEAEPETRVAVSTRSKGGGLAWELLQTIVLTLAISLGERSGTRTSPSKGQGRRRRPRPGSSSLPATPPPFKEQVLPLHALV